MIERAQGVYAHLAAHSADAALVFGPENRRWYTGFTGSIGYAVFLADKRAVFFTDTRYTIQACGQCGGYQILPLENENSLFAYMKKHKVRRLAVEEVVLSWRFGQALLREGGVAEFVPLDEVIRRGRMRKSPEEIALLRAACRHTDAAFAHILTAIRPGMTEADINFELQTSLRRQADVESVMDRYIVASGPRGSMPHGVASGRPVQRGDFITMDYGCRVGGYWSDMTRTVCLGAPSPKQREMYEVVRVAQQAGVAAARAGKTGRQVDAVARAIIKEAGYGDNFGHGLGHGLGLAVHEAPRLAPTPEGDRVLEAGMVVTVEPGVYIEGLGGVRIEDDIVLTETGCEVLTQSPRELIEL